MEKFVTRLKKLLLAEFPKSEVTVDPLEPPDKVTGILVWNGFDELDQLDRQHTLWKALRKRLTPADQRKVTVVLTMTPDEMAAIREG